MSVEGTRWTHYVTGRATEYVACRERGFVHVRNGESRLIYPETAAAMIYGKPWRRGERWTISADEGDE